MLCFAFLRFLAQPVTSPNLASNLLHDTCLNKKFSIVFYVIQDSAFKYSVPNANTLNTLITTTLTPFVNLLNTTFKRICVSFVNCSTVVIPNYPFNNWTQNIVDPVVTANWYTDKTINIYLPVSVTATNGVEQDGYTYPPPTNSLTPAKDVVVLPLNSLFASNGATFIGSGPLHVMGHFFGLPNTFDELGPPSAPPPPSSGMSYEYFDRTNCAVNGDLFCDTEADPYPQLNDISWSCGYKKIPGLADGKGGFYVPPVDNIMSNYGCRCRYSQQQYNHMARVILKQRLYLH